MFMTTTIKTIIGLFIITLLACSNSSNNKDETVIDKKTVENYKSNVIFIDGNYQILKAIYF